MRRENVADALSLEAHCTLHFYFAPHLAELEKLLKAYGYPPMKWDTSTKGFTKCPLRFNTWPGAVGKAAAATVAKPRSDDSTAAAGGVRSTS